LLATESHAGKKKKKSGAAASAPAGTAKVEEDSDMS
jgi:hypothetical protein